MKTFRKIIVVFIISISAVAIAKAQGAYVNVDVGYNLSAASDVIGVNTTTSNNEIVKGTFGKGISFGLGVGYMFSENVGAEIAFSYLVGSKIETTDNDGTITGTSEAKSKLMRLTPALKVTGGKSIKPYAKFGVILGLAPKVEIESTGSGLTYTSTGNDKLSGGMSIGLMGAAGVDIELSKMVSVFVELNSFNQSWAPDKDEWTSTVTSLGTTETESGTVNYEDKVSTSSSQSGSSTQQLKMYVPFSSFGIHLGVKLAFGGSK